MSENTAAPASTLASRRWMVAAPIALASVLALSACDRNKESNVNTAPSSSPAPAPATAPAPAGSGAVTMPPSSGGATFGGTATRPSPPPTPAASDAASAAR
ncbi:hypothetical protein ACAN107058_05835 [Paracidovorax anthurii]|uniref:Uncharacterized protein n=1 Tax=Paracidovorax anthurii TaxID=78229 RepID=A0A328ZKR8_9BURK|nr:hypothetical protein [Paracidovorax anthurii]RAR86501.1 hypothetical protein AX018_100187 [Paracidovorax anthurii]